jgi:hypothetical protein
MSKTLDEVKASNLGSKENYYRAIATSMRLVLPAFKSPIVTVDFLRQVKTGVIRLPKVDDLKPFVCVFPPTLKRLREELVSALREERWACMEPACLIQHIEKRSADKEWLLQMLHLTNEECCYFQPQYRPEAKKKEQDYVLIVNDEDGFFS